MARVNPGKVRHLAKALGILAKTDAIDASTLLDGKTGQRGLYALPMGRYSNRVHIWNSLLERAGFTLADIPTGWERSGRSGATKCSPPCARPWVATTYGASDCPYPRWRDTEEELLQFELAYACLARQRPPASGRRPGREGGIQSRPSFPSVPPDPLSPVGGPAGVPQTAFRSRRTPEAGKPSAPTGATKGVISQHQSEASALLLTLIKPLPGLIEPTAQIVDHLA